jgi:hypothetical protein
MNKKIDVKESIYMYLSVIVVVIVALVVVVVVVEVIVIISVLDGITHNVRLEPTEQVDTLISKNPSPRES